MSDKVDANDVARAAGPVGLARELDALTAAAPEHAATLRNFRTIPQERERDAGGRPREKREAVPVQEMTRDLVASTGGWPKRVGELLFADEAGTVRLMEKPEDFFAWAQERLCISWGHGQDDNGHNLTPKKRL